MHYVNIVSAKQSDWEKYFEFYKSQNFFSEEMEYKTLGDFRKAKFQKAEKSESDNFIFCDTDKCKANIFLFGKNEKTKTFNVKINFLEERTDKNLILAIIDFFHRLIREKTGYTFVIFSTQKIVLELRSHLNTIENEEYLISRLYRKNINKKAFTETYEKLKDDFSDYNIKKFFNYGDCNLSDYKNFLEDFESDFQSISEGGNEELTLEDLQNHRDQLIKETRERISYMMCNDKNKIIAVTNFEPRQGVIYISLTGVVKKLRGKNIAEYLKIFSVLDLLKTIPEFEYFQTRMNSKNTIINSLNDKLGFQIHETSYEFVLR